MWRYYFHSHYILPAEGLRNYIPRIYIWISAISIPYFSVHSNKEPWQRYLFRPQWFRQLFLYLLFLADNDGICEVIISSGASVNIILTSKVEINSTFYVSTIVPLNFFNYTNFNDSFMKIITGNCYRVLTEQQLWYCFIDKNTHYAKICAMVSVIKETECTNARNGVEPVNINFNNCTFLPLYMYLFPVIVQCLIRSFSFYINI